jgi:hypothetical protein
MENLQVDLNRLGEWAVENVMVINPANSKAVCFMGARVTEPLSYSLQDILIQEASSCKYLGIILHGDLSWADQGVCMYVYSRGGPRSALAPRPSLIYCASPLINPLLIPHFE